ncbi:D-alanyl-D-alanine carboxypeptidase [Chryseobacterium sp. Leaf405]|uniref:serine hydrolase domain-containing protein n=1 Tax=Chryseobacterium sp. Leaf405 TaxID=1736367 RepID=UPI0006F57C53|nr:serine hydrolase domain-containing protein [Chryseobacterium sp. Leaf405]KQT21594.1 D-alanyl-D-alanine carboxypeptidase [Chryseobacterium sp. Leaf405]
MFKKLLFLSALGISTAVFSQQNVKEKLGSYFDSLFVHHKVMGSFAFAENDRPTFVKVIGFADVEKKQKANINTQYRIGSISKTFTAVLVMKAVEDKKISLDKKLSDFYPEIPNADKITIENLLQHRTGIHNLTDEAEFAQYYTKPQTGNDLVAIIKKYKSDFEPGSKHEYSNSNFILLGLILEKVYKKSYTELIKTKIAKPLKLISTGVGGKIDTSKDQAKSYQYFNGIYLAAPETDMSVPIGAGNIVSTPRELLIFILGLENGKLIKRENVDKMKNFIDDYGYGLVKFPFEKYSGFGHNGAIDGFRSELVYFPELKTAVSFITNQEDMDSDDIFDKMMAAATGKDFKMPDFKGIVVSADILKKYEGNYKTKDFPLDIKIFIENGVLKGQATGQDAFPLEAVSENEFKFDIAGIKVKFNAENGTMDFAQGANQFTFKKE